MPIRYLMRKIPKALNDSLDVVKHYEWDTAELMMTLMYKVTSFDNSIG